MPFVRIDLIEGKPLAYRQAVAAAIYETMVSVLKVPEKDRFQVISEHAAENFIFDPAYLDISRSSDCVIVQITLNAGRDIATKKEFYARLAELLEQQTGLRPQDLFINFVEVEKESWSFGNGIAQYAAEDQLQKVKV